MLRKAIVDTKFGDTKKAPGDGTTTVGMTRQKS